MSVEESSAGTLAIRWPLSGASVLGLCLILFVSVSMGNTTTIDPKAIQPDTWAVHSESPVINLRWDAKVKTEGGAFLLYGETAEGERVLLAEVDAHEGLHSYRHRDRILSEMSAIGLLRLYELLFRTADGHEIPLGRVLVAADDFLPGTDLTVGGPQILAVLSSWILLPQLEEAWLDRPAPTPLGDTLRCPPTPPPEKPLIRA